MAFRLDPVGKTVGTASWWRALLPAVSLAAVIVVIVTLIASADDGLPPQHKPAFEEVLRSQAQSTEMPGGAALLSPFVWAATAMVLAALFVAGIVVFAWVFLRVAVSRRRVLGVAVLAGVTVVLGLVVWMDAPSQDETIQGILVKLYGIERTIVRPQFARITDALLVCNVLLATLACCSLCGPIRGNQAEEIRRRSSYLTVILYLGAFSLSAAVLQVYWTFKLPGNAAVLGLSPGGLDVVAGGLGILAGSTYSLIWAALYAPTAALLLTQAREAAARDPSVTTAKEESEWLKDQGFAVSGWQVVLRLAAIVAPLISGWMGEPAGRLISTLGLGG